MWSFLNNRVSLAFRQILQKLLSNSTENPISVPILKLRVINFQETQLPCFSFPSLAALLGLAWLEIDLLFHSPVVPSLLEI